MNLLYDSEQLYPAASSTSLAKKEPHSLIAMAIKTHNCQGLPLPQSLLSVIAVITALAAHLTLLVGLLIRQRIEDNTSLSSIGPQIR
jgi:hypothetical protein